MSSESHEPPSPQHDPRTSDLLRQAVHNATSDGIHLGNLIEPLQQRAFGFLLLLLTLPSFVPIPLGIGGPVGLLAMLTGLQMLLGLNRPWLPRRLANHRIKRGTADKILQYSLPLLTRIERLCRPRLERLTRYPANLLSGLLLLVIGFLLALPIPFTNWPIGALLLLYGVSLMERDGVVLLSAWILSFLTIGVFAGSSHALLRAIHALF